LREFFARAGLQQRLLILAFILFYKLGDSLATARATPFYLDLGYAKSDIGLVAKHPGLWPAVFGGLLGGLWMVSLGINRALWLFGIVQVVSIFGFAWLAALGPQHEIDACALVRLAAVIGFEALGVGLGTAAFVAFIARAPLPASGQNGIYRKNDTQLSCPPSIAELSITARSRLISAQRRTTLIAAF